MTKKPIAPQLGASLRGETPSRSSGFVCAHNILREVFVMVTYARAFGSY